MLLFIMLCQSGFYFDVGYGAVLVSESLEEGYSFSLFAAVLH